MGAAVITNAKCKRKKKNPIKYNIKPELMTGVKFIMHILILAHYNL